jgi:hypothetical protein
MNPFDVLLSLGHEIVDLIGTRLAPFAAHESGTGTGSPSPSGPSFPPPAVPGELSEAYTARTGIAVPTGCKFDPWLQIHRPDGGIDLGGFVPVSALFTAAP